jgi:hypothetical protein
MAPPSYQHRPQCNSSINKYRPASLTSFKTLSRSSFNRSRIMAPRVRPDPAIRFLSYLHGLWDLSRIDAAPSLRHGFFQTPLTRNGIKFVRRARIWRPANFTSTGITGSLLRSASFLLLSRDCVLSGDADLTWPRRDCSTEVWAYLRHPPPATTGEAVRKRNERSE